MSKVSLLPIDDSFSLSLFVVVCVYRIPYQMSGEVIFSAKVISAFGGVSEIGKLLLIMTNI